MASDNDEQQIRVTDFEEMNIHLSRAVATENAEEYIIKSDHEKVGEDLGEFGQLPHLGRMILLYASGAGFQSYTSGSLLLYQDWEEPAISSLVDLISRRVIQGVGVGGHTLDSFDISVYSVDKISNWGDITTEGPERGFVGLYSEVESSQEMIEELPDTLSKVTDEIMEEREDEFREILESDHDEEEKENMIRENIKIGMERSLPTILFERESESRGP
ncbi:hypothetical protein [Natronorubrum texcoconense]|nr:hypothetical protein [Natronorubrum texcoconense]